MKNFSVKVDGKEYWISRSVATCGFVFKKEGDTIFCLVEQRGPGAADYVHSFCAPCGYLDYDESGKQCIAREIMEECGFKCDLKKLKMVAVNSDPKENRQNVTLHYTYKASESEEYYLKQRKGGEENEIELVTWAPVATIGKGKKVKINEKAFEGKTWAFGHEKLIKKYCILCYEKEKE